MKVHILSSLFLCLLCNLIFAQQTEQVYIDYGQDAYSLTAGEGTFQITTSSADGQMLNVLNTDDNGAVDNSLSFNQNGRNISFVNDFFYEIDTIETNGQADILYSKYDQNGNQLWQKTLLRPLDNYGVKFIPTTDNHLLLGGVTAVGGDSLLAIFLTKMDEDGNVLWQRIVDKGHTKYDMVFGYLIGISNSDLFPIKEPGLSKMWAAKDGGYLIQNIHGTSAAAGPSLYHNYIKTDAFGKVIWSNSFLVGSKNISTPIPNGGIYLTSGGHADTYADGSVVVSYNAKIGTSSYFSSRLKKYDATGVVVVEKNLGTGTDWPSESYAVGARADGGMYWVVDDKTMHQYNVGYRRNRLMLYEVDAAGDFEDYLVLDFPENGLTDGVSGNVHFGTNYDIEDFVVINDMEVGILGEIGDDVNYANAVSLKIPFFLKIDMNEGCTTAYEDFEFFGSYLGHDYYLSKNTATIAAATTMATDIGGYLMVPNSFGENEFFDFLVYGGSSWMGLNDATTEGEFLLADGNPLTYQNFFDCQPSCSNSDDFDHVYFDFNTGTWRVEEVLDGQHYFIVEIDCNQTNQAGADIALNTTQILPFEMAKNIPFEQSVQLKNYGSEAIIEPFSVTAYLSNDARFDSEDVLIGEVEIMEMPLSNSEDYTMTLTVPSTIAAGFYKVIYIADEADVVSELTEANNMVISNTQMRIKEDGPDIQITGMTDVTLNPLQGGMATFIMTVENAGNLPITEPVKVGIYRNEDTGPYYYHNSPDLIFDTELIQEITLNDLPIGSVDVPVSIPIAADALLGSKFRLNLYADFENEYTEVEEDNNHYTLFNTFEIAGDFAPDLRVTNVGPLPSTLTQGETVQISFTVENVGTRAAETEFAVNIGLSFTQFSISDEFEEGTSLENLQPGESQNFTFDYVVPPHSFPFGNYYFHIRIDDEEVIPETDETNNITYISSVEIVETPNADLTVDNVVGLPDTASQGDVIFFNFDLINEGEFTANGEYTITMFLNPYNNFSINHHSSAIESGIVPTGFTPPGIIPNVGGGITVPDDIPVGQYYLVVAVDVDFEVAENDKTNNYILVPIYINSSVMDFAVGVECPEDITISAAGGATAAVVSWDESTLVTTENCTGELTQMVVGQCAGVSNGSQMSIGTETIVYGVSAFCNEVFSTTTCEFDITVVEHPQFTEETMVTICAGELYEGVPYTDDTILTDTLFFADFDSIFVTQISVLENFATTIIETTCDPNGAGVFTQNLTAINGCDSVVTVQVELIPTSETNLSPAICQGESIIVNGIVFDETNPVGTTTLINQYGCDSLVNVSLSILENTESTVELTIMEGELYNGLSISMDTTIIENYEATNGCDSTVTVQIEVLPVATNEQLKAQFSLSVFPNPASQEVIFIRLKGEETQDWSVRLYNNLGQEVETNLYGHWQSMGGDILQTSVRGLEKGIYFLVLEDEGVQLVERVVIF